MKIDQEKNHAEDMASDYWSLEHHHTDGSSFFTWTFDEDSYSYSFPKQICLCSTR